ncbi:hypothetical protein N431DRAFT_428657 [Stipitochalara longipes BDJ]|nr:hypothetical protein N431DRAFT_428657 [Stipitochalara longipes BDJ]
MNKSEEKDSSLANISKFWDLRETSIFIDKIRGEQRDDNLLRWRMETMPKAEQDNVMFEARSIQSRIKWALIRFGEMAIHDGNHEPLGSEAPGISLNQMLMRHMVVSTIRATAIPAAHTAIVAIYENSQGQCLARCKICLNLADKYGKTTLKELQRSRRGCSSCQLIVDILGIYNY